LIGLAESICVDRDPLSPAPTVINAGTHSKMRLEASFSAALIEA
jgi:hypothetical protein